MDMSSMKQPQQDGLASSTMSMNNSSQSSGASSMDFHAGVGDTLWFQHFVPSTPASMFGTCVLLFFIAILSRMIDSFSRSLNIKWSTEAKKKLEKKVSSKQKLTSLTPFIFTNDLSRGILFLVQAGFSYLLMLAVMTYNGYFFISVLIGLGVGETCFGRFSRSAASELEDSGDLVQHFRSESQEYPLLETSITPISMKREPSSNS